MEQARKRSAHQSALLLMCLLLASASGKAQTPRSRLPARPNLLLITFDTTRADRLPPYGYRQAHTPAISRLAREGVVFSNTYAPANTNNANGNATGANTTGATGATSSNDDNSTDSHDDNSVDTCFTLKSS